MDARASHRVAQIPTGVARVFLVALVAAFLLGGTGGYLVRGLSLAQSSTRTTDITKPFVIEPVPYSSPVLSPAPQPTLDPTGFTVPI